MELPDKAFLPEMSLAVEAAKTAGEQVMRIYGGQFSHTLKNGHEPVTEADILSDEIIRKILSPAGYAILSEEKEDTEERIGQKRVWIMDPLDGTSDFVNRTGEFSIMIALVEAGVPIMGVVFRPENGILYIAQKGQGAYQRQDGTWQAMRVSGASDLRQARAVVSRHHLSEKEESFLKTAGIFEFVQMGSSGLKIVEVALGKADLYFSTTNKMKQWDTAAAHCIIKEAGGQITDMLGQELIYNTQDIYHQNGILTTNGVLQSAVAALYNERVFPAKDFMAQAAVKPEQYRALYKESLQDPEKFWGKIASQEIEWFSPWSQVFTWQPPRYQWFVGGKLNITHNCLDRHARGERQNKIAFIHIDEKGSETSVTYKELLEQVNKFANALRSLGVAKGDRVVIYMPLVIEQAVAMLGCARIGAIHSVVFAGLSDKALRQRLVDSEAKVVVTANWTLRRGKKIDLKSVVEEAVVDLDFVEKVMVLQREKDYYQLTEKEVDWHELISAQPEQCESAIMDSEDPLFILYTSGSTGQPKGVLHTIGGYSVFTHYTTKTVFDLKENDIYWCTADPGWITGHSYVVYGPLSVGATVLLVEGAPDYPAPDRWWKIIEKYKVSIFYTSPTAIRLLRKHGEKYIAPHKLDSLRLLGSVGEPINPEVWKWFYTYIGQNHCALVDTWWQTETGGHMIVTLPSLPQKPGQAGLSFFGIEADIVDKEGNSLPAGEKGFLVIRKPWPAALRTCWHDEERFAIYWNEIPGVYCTGDFAIKDEDGYIQIIGRADDVLNISGHRIGTAEVESALVSHQAVAESAAIGKQHEIKGQSLKVFIVLKPGIELLDQLQDDIKLHVRHELGGYAVPDEIEFVPKLPKTRSGKIMRRLLRAQEAGEEAGDLTTLED